MKNQTGSSSEASTKAGKYFKYAIGEIILVVIGILIALQVNTWKENIEITKSKKTQLNSLKQDLNDDLKNLKTYDSLLLDRLKSIDAIYVRLQQPSTNMDTLVKICQKEFNPYTTRFSGFKRTTYESLINTGDIKLLNNTLKKDLSELSIEQSYANVNQETHFKNYLETVQDHLAEFPRENIAVYPFSKGPLYNAIWNNIDEKSLLISFNEVMGAQKLFYALMSNSTKPILNKTQHVLETHFND